MSLNSTAILILHLLLLISYSGHAQGKFLLPDTVQLNFEELGVHQGLSAGLARRMLIDQKGFLWIGTGNGLNRFDGYSITSFTHISGDSLSMPSKLENYAKPMFYDSQNNLYLYNNELGAFQFENATESFHALDIPLGEYNFKDDSGLIWSLNEEDQWYIIDPECLNETIGHQKDKTLTECYSSVQERFHGIEHNLPTWTKMNEFDLVVLPNQLWMTIDSQLVAYTLDYINHKARFLYSISLKSYFPKQELANAKVCFTQDQKKGFLLSPYGYCEFDPNTGKSIQVYSFPSRHVDQRLLYLDSKDRLWIKTVDGLLRLDLLNERISVIKSIEGDTRMIETYQILEDDHQNLWIGTLGYGVFKHSINKERFQYIGDRYFGPPAGRLMLISDNNIAMQFRGIQILDKTAKRWVPLVVNDTLFKEIGFSDYHSVHFMPNGQFFYRKNFSVGDSIKFGQYNMNEQGQIIKSVYSPRINQLIYSDSHSSWTIEFPVTDYKNVSLDISLIYDNINSDPDTFSFYPGGFLDSHLNSSAVTGNNKVWLSFDKRGLLMFDKRSETWKWYRERSDYPDSLSSDIIYTILPDPSNPDSLLWLGSSNGLILYDILNNSFTSFTRDNGLADDVIYGILADHNNNLWLSSNKGLSHFDLKNNSFHNYDFTDGLQHNEFNRYAYIKDTSGILYFGGMGGMTYFDPKEFYQSYIESPLVITKMSVNNKVVKYIRDPTKNEDQFYLDKPIHLSPNIQLKPIHRIISFDFAVLDFNKPIGNTFRYQLEGYSNQWFDLGNKNTVTFTNLSPGNYSLHIQGTNYNGIWNLQGAKLAFTVLPYWWQTWWFRSLLILTIGVIIAWIIKSRIEYKMRILNLRAQISKDLHDDIGSTLSSISIFGLVAKNMVNKEPEKATALLDKISDETTSVMEAMNDIVWAINSEKDKVVDLIHRMRAYTSELFSGTPWKVEFILEDGLHDIELSMVQRRNAYLIFKEAVNNAFKHSKGDQLTIKFFRHNKYFILQVQDNGEGFDIENLPNKLNLGGNGLKNLELRATELQGTLEIKSEINRGTKIIFSFNPQKRSIVK